MNAESRLDARLRSTLERQSVGVDEIETRSALLAVGRPAGRGTRRKRIGYVMGGVLAAAAAGIAVAVMGPSGPPRQPEPVTSTPPAGTWQRTLSGAGQWSGRWSLTFSAGNVLALTTPAGLRADEAADGASYAVRADTLRL